MLFLNVKVHQNVIAGGGLHSVMYIVGLHHKLISINHIPHNLLNNLIKFYDNNMTTF